MEKPSINIISAGDRYNYGDVLYSVVMSEYLKKYEPEIYAGYNIEHYGIIKSDLTEAGGLETLPIRELYKKDFTKGSLKTTVNRLTRNTITMIILISLGIYFIPSSNASVADTDLAYQRISLGDSLFCMLFDIYKNSHNLFRTSNNYDITVERA